MRVGIVIKDLSLRGGEQRQAIMLARELQHMGHTVVIFAGKYDKEASYPQLLKGVVVKYCTQKKFDRPQGLRSMIARLLFLDSETQYYLKELRKLITTHLSKEPLDVLNYHDFFSYRLAPYFKLPQVWMMNDLPHLYDILYRGTSGFYHNKLARTFIRLASLWEHYYLANISIIAVLDNRNKTNAEDLFRRSVDIRVVRSGLDFTQSNLNKKKSPMLQLLTTNIFYPHRRYEDSLKALYLLKQSGLKNFHFTVVGDTSLDPSYANYIKSLISKYSLQSHITLKGKISEAELHDEYAAADIFLFPNHNQTWGLSVFEAMQYKCVPIVSNTSGAHEVLTDKQNALIVRAKHPEDIAASVSLLAKDKVLLSTLQEAAYRFVKKNISWKQYAHSMSALFSEVTDT